MKKLTLLLLSFGLLLITVHAQQDENILPKSFKLSSRLFMQTQSVELTGFDLQRVTQSDAINEKNGHLPLFSRNLALNVSLNTAGTWTTLNNGDRIWRIKISSKNALGLVPLFSKLFLPEGATLHVFMPGRQEVLGAFTHSNTPSTRSFCSGLIHGESCIIEYYEPALVKGQGILEMSETGHAYRWVTPLTKSTNSANAAGSCEVNVACSETNNFLDQKRAVARILVASTTGQGYCSGSLINNVRQDCTPYFLSAQHCSEGTTTAQYGQWVFYFNYEAATCTGTSGPTNKTVNGCTKIADSNDNGGDTGSDFLLLQLNSQPNATYNVYYAGWNTTTSAPTSGVSIHHPDGDIKKISTYTTTCTSTSWGGTVTGTHWNVKWAATTNGHGVTEPGSSGSSLFNSNGEIVGTLTGGNSYCNTPNNPDQYGKLAYHWISNGTANNRRLKPWLDPDNTGTASLSGTNTPCGSLVTNDAGISNINAPSGNICNVTSLSPQIVLRNYGSNTLTQVTINYSIDGNDYQYQFNGSLTSGNSTIITLGAVSVSSGSHTMTVETTFPNGQTDNNTANDSKTVSFSVIPPSGSMLLTIQTDDWGSETTWEVTDNAQNVLASGGPYSDVQNGQQYNESFCLAPGCYTFTIYDSYGDGMTSSVDGDFSLVGNNTVYATLTNASFGYSESHNFCVAATGINDNETNAIGVKVIPNPSSGNFQVTIQSEQEKNIKVYNALGQLIQQFNTGLNVVNINLNDQSKGVYLLEVETQQGKSVQKLILK